MWVYFMCDANVYNKGEGGCLKDKFAPFAKKMCPFCKKKGSSQHCKIEVAGQFLILEGNTFYVHLPLTLTKVLSRTV